MTKPFTPIVTFIASKPGSKFETRRPDPVRPAPGANAPTNPTFLGDVYDELLKKDGVVATGLPESRGAMKPMHMLVGVSDILQVGEWLSAYFLQHEDDHDKLRIQFIGHSVSGSLSLGGTWITNDDEKILSPYYVLESSPRPLTELSLYLGRIEKVMLAGCYIGSRQSNGNPVNGRTLLFTMAEMWHCEVRGANTSVGPGDFDGNGWYTNKQIPAIGWAWHPRNEATLIGKDDELQSRILPKHGLRTPIRISAGNLMIDAPHAVEMFASYFDAALIDAAKPNLGVNELAIQLHYERGHVVDAYFTCNGQFLVVPDGPTPTFYTHSQNEVSTKVSRIVAQLRAATRPTDGRSASPATPRPE